ncbi:MAG: carboxypeptidase regulatory-like domain-containing protein [Actinomycetota bacterium]
MNATALLPLLTSVAAMLLSQTPATAPQTCTVSGQVVRADSGEPLKSARVVLVENKQSEKPHTYRAVSDGNGHFSITGIAPGRYRFAATHNGFVPQQFRPEGASTAAPLELSPGQKQDKVLFRLTPAAVIAGKITDEDGQPLAGVETEALIDAQQAQSLGGSGDEAPEAAMVISKLKMVPIGMGVTNDLGEYRMYGLPAGDYYVAAIDSGTPELTEHSFFRGGIAWERGEEPVTDHPPMYYPGVFARNQAEKVHVSAGSTAEIDLTLRAEKMMKVSGRVLGENGQPVPGAYVILGSRDMDVMFSAMRNMASTDSQGRFTIQGVIPGTYVLQARNTRDNVRLSAELPMEIGSQPPTDVTLTLERGISIAGKIVAAEDPLPQKIDFSSLHLWLSPAGGSLFDFGAAEVKKDGTFKVSDLRRGAYDVHLTGLPSGWYLKSASLGATDALAQGVTVNSGSAPDLELRISSKAAQLSGTVMMDDKPVAGAVIRITPEHDSAIRRDLHRKTVTDQHGGFVLENLAPGAYTIQATVSGDNEAEESDAPSSHATTVETFELREAEKKTISLVLKQE